MIAKHNLLYFDGQEKRRGEEEEEKGEKSLLLALCDESEVRVLRAMEFIPVY